MTEKGTVKWFNDA